MSDDATTSSGLEPEMVDALRSEMTDELNGIIGAMSTEEIERNQQAILAAMTAIDEQRTAPGIDVGAPAPRFSLTSATGGTVSLDDRLSNGPVVLVFYRGGWCPVCNMHLRGLQGILGDLTDLGASLVALSPERPDASVTLAERLALGFDVLSDTDQSVAAAYRLRFELPTELRGIYRAMNMALDEHNSDRSWNLPVPATFVLDQDGIVRARHVNAQYWERMTPEDVLDAVRGLGRSA